MEVILSDWKRYSGKGYYMKTLEKPKDRQELSKKEKEKAFKGDDSLKPSEFSAFGAIDTSKEGIEVGLMTTVKFKFDHVGDRLVGYLKCRRLINWGEDFMVYDVFNVDGDWSFSGSKLVSERMKEVPDRSIVDITYFEKKMSKRRGQHYKNYRIKWYKWPDNVDPKEVRVRLTSDGLKIKPVDFPSDLGATAKTEDDVEKGV